MWGGYLKKIRFKELPGFMKELTKPWQFSRRLFDFFKKIENCDYINQVLDYFFDNCCHVSKLGI
jgi:hypothetical protein